MTPSSTPLDSSVLLLSHAEILLLSSTDISLLSGLYYGVDMTYAPASMELVQNASQEVRA